jgi:hypothetical protein
VPGAHAGARPCSRKNGRSRCCGLTPGIWTVVGRHEQGIEGVARVTKDKSETVELSFKR